jgi:hypothetical protein
MSDRSTTWLTTEQIRKRERMRRTAVIAAMDAGDLPYEQRGRVRYARDVDVDKWEQSRLRNPTSTCTTVKIHPALAHLI